MKTAADILLDECDAHLLSGRTWTVTSIGHTWYACSCERVGGRKRTLWLHRVVMGEPQGQLVDHKNRNGLDCRRENLRVATRQQNAANSRMRSDNTSGFRGVTFCKQTGRWAASVTIMGKHKKIGRFDTPEEAALARNAAAREAFGGFDAATTGPNLEDLL